MNGRSPLFRWITIAGATGAVFAAAYLGKDAPDRFATPSVSPELESNSILAALLLPSASATASANLRDSVVSTRPAALAPGEDLDNLR